MLGSRVLYACKELCKCTWSLSRRMQHRQSRVHCYSEAVVLVCTALVTLAGNCLCYCITGTTLVRLQECSEEIFSTYGLVVIKWNLR